LKPPSSDLATPSAETGLKTSPAPVELPGRKPAEPIVNVLAERYASPAIKDIWSTQGRILLERDFWIAGDEGAEGSGRADPGEAIKDYERVKDVINLESILKREQVTLHDVKARLEEFSELAGRQFIHLGLTSRDLTENVEQLQIFRSLKVIHFKAVAALLALSARLRRTAI